MKITIKLLLSVFFTISTITAQNTAIPDQTFEQALIDLNIDSDGVVNGQVLTADIENIVELDVSSLSMSDIIWDLTGIQNFIALEILNFNFANVILDETQADIFSSNVNLRELTMKNVCADCIGNFVQILDLSGLLNLELVDLEDVSVEILKFNNPSFDLSNLTLNLDHEGFPGGDWSQHICIEVADPQAATNNQFPYNTWNIIFNDFTTTYGFDDTCNLSVNDFENLNSISFYPNPVKDKLWIENLNKIEIDSAEIYTISGQMVGSYSSVNDFIEVGNLEAGIYFVKLFSDNSSKTFKVLKK